MTEPSPSSGPAVDFAWLARQVPRAALAGLALGWILAFAAAPGPKPASGNWGGDYPAFYTAGRIVAAGHGASLYDERTQQAEQDALLDEGYLPFLYPPFVAALFAPLALLPYRWSYLAFTLLSFASLLGSLRLAAPLSALVGRDRWLAAGAMACFYPLLRSMLGGQNTVLLLLLVVGVWRLLHDEKDVLAGALLGLLAFKPQYFAALAGLVLMSRRPRVLAGLVATGVALYFASAAVSGWDWPGTWFDAVAAFAARDRDVNAVNSISLDGLVHAAGFDVLRVPLVAALSLWAAIVAWRDGGRDVAGLLALGCLTALLTAPHAMFYDFGLALPALLLMADRGRAREAALFWLAGASQLAAAALGVSPLAVVAPALLWRLRSVMLRA